MLMNSPTNYQMPEYIFREKSTFPKLKKIPNNKINQINLFF